MFVIVRLEVFIQKHNCLINVSRLGTRNKTVTYISMTHNLNEAVFCHMSETNNDNICQDHYHVP